MQLETPGQPIDQFEILTELENSEISVINKHIYIYIYIYIYM
jgi:hypothetical protein